MLIANNIYTVEQGLIGSECQNCGERFFPQVTSCANCSHQTLTITALGHFGHLWSWTIQHYIPKAPYSSGETKETFTPYGVGLVQMECGLIIKSRLRLTKTPLTIGQKMDLHITSFNKNSDERIETYEFQQADVK